MIDSGQMKPSKLNDISGCILSTLVLDSFCGFLFRRFLTYSVFLWVTLVQDDGFGFE